MSVAVLLVRKGADFRHPRGAHTIFNVYPEMLLQVCSDYPGLPDARELTMRQIRFFYGALRHGLRETTKPRERNGR